MKKLIALVLAMVMLLCGCAAGTTIKEEKALSELGEGTRAESVAIVKVTINPEFELYLDGAFCVTKVRCLNEDAVTAFEPMQAYDVPVIGLRYEEAMPVILDSIASAGFLTEGTDKIKVDATLLMEFPEAEMAAMSEIFSAPVTYYTTEHELNVEVVAPAPVLADDAKKVAWAGDAPNGNDGQNNSVITGTPNSELTFTMYENDAVIGEGIRYFDENGILYKETHSFTNGTTQEVLYYENGNLKSDVTNRPDGSIEQYFREDGTQSYYLEDTAEQYYEMTFYPNGNRETETYKQGEKSITSTFYENGDMKSSISDEPDGHFEWHYFEDGKEKLVIADTEEGYSRNEYIYHENGNMQSQITDDKYGHTESYFSEDGTLIQDNYTDAYGNMEETTFYPNGNLCTFYKKEATGCEQVCEYYENGNLKSSIQTSGDEHYEDYYYEDGTLQKSIHSDSTGSYSELHYYSNGELALNIVKNGATYSETHYDSTVKGYLTKSIRDTEEEYYEVHYYQNENMSLQIYWDKGTGDYYEAHYDQDGNIISEHSETR